MKNLGQKLVKQLCVERRKRNTIEKKVRRKIIVIRPLKCTTCDILSRCCTFGYDGE